MKAQLNGNISGITLADSISQIEIVWLTSAGEAPATAQAAGRGVILTTSADLANFTQAVQGGVSPTLSGYMLDSALLVDLTTYYGAAKVTENMTGSGTQAGDWSTPTSFYVTTVVSGHAIAGALAGSVSLSTQLLTQIVLNASVSGSATVPTIDFAVPADVTAPVVTAFVVPSTSSSLTVNITTLTATDAVGVAAYMIKTTNTPPLAGDAGWVANPTTCTAPTEGGYIFYAWAKDANGNVSASLASGICTITIPDTTPSAFTFTDVTSATLSTLYTSNTITVAGINTATAISITGGEYQIDSGSWVTSAGTVVNGDTVTVRNTSSASEGTAVNTVLTIGGVSDTYTTTTLVSVVGFTDAFTGNNIAPSTTYWDAPITQNLANMRSGSYCKLVTNALRFYTAATTGVFAYAVKSKNSIPFAVGRYIEYKLTETVASNSNNRDYFVCMIYNSDDAALTGEGFPSKNAVYFYLSSDATTARFVIESISAAGATTAHVSQVSAISTINNILKLRIVDATHVEFLSNGAVYVASTAHNATLGTNIKCLLKLVSVRTDSTFTTTTIDNFTFN